MFQLAINVCLNDSTENAMFCKYKFDFERASNQKPNYEKYVWANPLAIKASPRIGIIW